MYHCSQWHVCFCETNWCVRLASPGRPRFAPVRSNSFDVIPGTHPGQPPVLCLWSGSLGDDLRCMPSPREGDCDHSISSCQGLTRVPRGRPREANQTHPKDKKYLREVCGNTMWIFFLSGVDSEQNRWLTTQRSISMLWSGEEIGAYWLKRWVVNHQFISEPTLLRTNAEIFTCCIHKPLLVILPSCKVLKSYLKAVDTSGNYSK